MSGQEWTLSMKHGRKDDFDAVGLGVYVDVDVVDHVVCGRVINAREKFRGWPSLDSSQSSVGKTPFYRVGIYSTLQREWTNSRQCNRDLFGIKLSEHPPSECGR